MRTRNLTTLVLKHFNFLKEEYGFKYKAEDNCYCKTTLSIEVHHESGELKVVCKTKRGEELLLLDCLGKLRKKEFSYPEYFSPFIISMGDVDSRLAYDAKLIKEYGQEILEDALDHF